MKVLSLCVGYGGLDLAVGHTPTMLAEVDRDASKVLARNWPDVPNVGDLRDVPTDLDVDLVTAGFPCQPVSSAGRRRGIDDERWLWDDIADLLGRMGTRPRWLFLENVRGLLSANGGAAMARVVHRLADLGYVGSWRVVRASDAGACHRRERWFCAAVLADPPGGCISDRTVGGGQERFDVGAVAGAGDRAGARSDSEGVHTGHLAEGVGGAAADADGALGGPRDAERRDGPPPAGGRGPQKSGGCGGAPTHADCVGCEGAVARTWGDNGRGNPGPLPPTPCANEPGGTVEDYHRRLREARPDSEPSFVPLSILAPTLLPTPTVGDSKKALNITARRTAPPPSGANKPGWTMSDVANADRWSHYADAIARHEQALGRPAPDPTDDRRRLSPRFVEWMMMLPEGWVTDCDISRTAQLRILGNGVVPPQARMAWEALS